MARKLKNVEKCERHTVGPAKWQKQNKTKTKTKKEKKKNRKKWKMRHKHCMSWNMARNTEKCGQ